MPNFTGKTTQGERINFGFKDIRHNVKNNELVILDRSGDVFVKYSTVEVEKNGKEIIGSNFPLAALVSRLGYH
jgi:hypothetical protein